MKNNTLRREKQVPAASRAATSALQVPEYPFADPRAHNFGATSSRCLAETAMISKVSNDRISPEELSERSARAVLERTKLLCSSDHSVDSVQEWEEVLRASTRRSRDYGLGNSIAPASGLARTLACVSSFINDCFHHYLF